MEDTQVYESKHSENGLAECPCCKMWQRYAVDQPNMCLNPKCERLFDVKEMKEVK